MCRFCCLYWLSICNNKMPKLTPLLLFLLIIIIFLVVSGGLVLLVLRLLLLLLLLLSAYQFDYWHLCATHFSNGNYVNTRREWINRPYMQCFEMRFYVSHCANLIVWWFLCQRYWFLGVKTPNRFTVCKTGWDHRWWQCFLL